ncbi:MAG TPA: glycosyltransferase family 39 protein [Methylomusa anaerophila]|uniref:Dolichyl-phosphate-mannose-protein mannosyltransferase n=1 Tax=Methylomusa anaerophila TaxID=1930071 RepID=A0A348AGE1_9FIRM|nr:glycosyltransferase family 39 protein [Methylomusa anaerophila]BBB90139.1 dolichyl-phosphate-mannose-protein mannosyltransferase [Methylomusa anaerophila]HML88137.1 glycosyltransferase family 39 protein [Methylomusa anaerophila]
MNRKILIVACCIIIINLGYNAFLPLHPDEAYYWTWSQNLQLSYFDHPPLIAYLIKLFTLFSTNEWSIRLVSVFCLSVSSWLVYRLAAEMFSGTVAALSLLIFLFIPITQIGFQVVTPDAPLILFWTGTVYFSYQAIFRNKVRYLYFAGLTGGFMLLSKYTGILLFPALLVFLMASKHRRLLGSSHFYSAALLAGLIFSPVLFWNWQHDWISFKFQYGHGMAQNKVFDIETLGQYVAGQAGIINPVFFLAMIFYAYGKIRENMTNDKLAFLFWPLSIVLFFFGYAALFKKVEPNWPVAAYITGTILLSYWLDRYKKNWIVVTGIVLTTLMTVLVRYPEAFPFLPPKAVLKAHYYGYADLLRTAGKYVTGNSAVVISDNYQNASMAWYYLEGRPEVHIITSSRFSNYDYWRAKLVDHPPNEALYIGDKSKLPELNQMFEKVQLVDILKFRNPYVTREFNIYRCSGFKGFLPQQTQI